MTFDMTAKPFNKAKYLAPNLADMLSYKRPQGSRYQKKFCRRFLEPVFGQPDRHGNYTLIINNHNNTLPNIAFMSHHDTVHKDDGIQSLFYQGDVVGTTGKDCLGADCTTGVYIMLRMIEAKVPGVYVVHAAEEIGCVGSSNLVKDAPSWIDHVKAAISFDRKGFDSIITHQMCMRTCSDAFADSFSAILDMGHKKDDTGSYTDSNEYVGVIGECTNLSVGYLNQHTIRETQDLAFVEYLIDHLINADWSCLVFKRQAGDVEYDKNYYTFGKKGSSKSTNSGYGWPSLDYYDDTYYQEKTDYAYKGEPSISELQDLVSVIKKYPEQIADILASYGYSADGLIDDCVDLRDKWNRKYRNVGA